MTEIKKVCLKEAKKSVRSYAVKNPYFALKFQENGAIVLSSHFSDLFIYGLPSISHINL